MTVSSTFLGNGFSEKNFLLNELYNTQNVRNYVVSRSPDQQVLSTLIDLSGGSMPMGSQFGQRLIRMPYLPPGLIGAIIKTAGRTLQAGNTQLVLQFTDTTYKGFINDLTVQSTNGTFGKVLSWAPGQITIGLIYSVTGNATFQAADFAAGTGVSARTDVSGANSKTKQYNQRNPLQQSNVIGKQRYTYIAERENLGIQTAIEWKGQEYWAYSGLDLSIQDYKNQRELGLLYNPFVNVEDNWMSGGFQWQMANQGSGLSTYGGTVTLDLFTQLIEEKQAQGYSPKEYVVLYGSSFMASFQTNVVPNFVQTAGKNNVIGGAEVKAINAMEWSTLGCNFKFISYPLLNAAEANMLQLSTFGKLKSSYSAIFLDTSKVQTSNGMRPWVDRYYFGHDGGDNVSIQEGTIDLMGRKSRNRTMDSETAQMDSIFDECVQLNDPQRHIWLNVAS